MTIFLSADRGSISDDVVLQAVTATRRWGEDVLRFCLGYFSRQSLPLPFGVTYALADRDERVLNSVVVRRHTEKFKSLFATRLSQHAPRGYVLPQPSRERKLEYRPASATLLAGRTPPAEIASKTIPQFNLSGGKTRLLVNLWNESSMN